MPEILSSTKLRIRNQAGLLNQIAGVYTSFFRAAMEYVDNAVDAAASIQVADPTFVGRIDIRVDLAARRVSIEDNCGGMSPEQLCGLVSEVGESKKKSVPWANGQFGFGVHAFRGFAEIAQFTSRPPGSQAARIVIDRSKTESDRVDCVKVPSGECLPGHTVVCVSEFDAHHFRKNQFVVPLMAEIERHFDDVLRARTVEIYIWTAADHNIQLHGFDFTTLDGASIKRSVEVLEGGAVVGEIAVDLKLLETLHEGRPAVLTNKGRRIQAIADLQSYKRFVQSQGRSPSVWANPFLTGSVEINNLVSPNLTRDDLKDSPVRAAVYSAILDVQLSVEELVGERQQRRRSEAYDDLATRISDCLADVLRKYKIRFDDAAIGIGNLGSASRVPGNDVPFGGDEAGGGGPGPDGVGSGGKASEGGSSGPGSDDDGGGDSGTSRASTGAENGAGSGRGFPRIEFQEYPEEPLRIVPFGAVLHVNVSHPDFTSRKGGGAMSQRLASYVAQIVAGPCVEYAFARKRAVATPELVLSQATDISLRLEDVFLASAILDEVLVADGS